MKKLKILLSVLLLLTARPTLHTQVFPAGSVFDVPLFLQSQVIVTLELFMKLLLDEEKPFQEEIANFQEFFGKARTIVNGAVKDLRMINEIIEMQSEITTLFSNSIIGINEFRDANNDSVDDLAFMDKWKQIQILTALSGEAISVFELFVNTVEQDATVMNDKARVRFIQKAHEKLRLIKSSMRVQIRRINKEIYRFKRNQKEIQLFAKLFEAHEN